jgi:hypothetical protein
MPRSCVVCLLSAPGPFSSRVLHLAQLAGPIPGECAHLSRLIIMEALPHWPTESGGHIVSGMRLLPITLVALVACSQKSSQTVSNAQTDAPSVLTKLADTTKMFSGSGGHRYGPPTGKIRVANLLELNGQPGGPVDLYDVRQPDSTAAPLIKNLAFGQVSDYVSPRAADPYAGSHSNLYFFPAGSNQAAAPYGSSIDNIGFASTDQISVALGPTTFAGTSSIAFPALDEAGTRLNTHFDSLRVVPPGQALLVLLKADVSADSLPEMYLMIDGLCPPTTTYPKNTHPTSVGADINFAVSPGSHAIGIVTSPRGMGLLDCKDKTPGQTSSINVAAGQRYLVFVYGLASDGFKTVTAPIAP